MLLVVVFRIHLPVKLAASLAVTKCTSDTGHVTTFIFIVVALTYLSSLRLWHRTGGNCHLIEGKFKLRHYSNVTVRLIFEN
jgi:hypothetical protein